MTHYFRKGDCVHYAGESQQIDYWAYGKIKRFNREGTQVDVRFDEGTCRWVNERGQSWIKLENVRYAGRDPTTRQQNKLSALIGELLHAA